MIHLVPPKLANRLLPFADHTWEHFPGRVPQPHDLPGRLILRASPDGGNRDVWRVFSIDRDRRTGRFAALKDWLSPLGLPKLPPYDYGGEVYHEPTSMPDRTEDELAAALFNIDFRCSLAFVFRSDAEWWKLPPHLVLVSWQSGLMRGTGQARLFYVSRGLPEVSFGHSPMCPAKVRSVMRPAPAKPVHVATDSVLVRGQSQAGESITRERDKYVSKLWERYGH